MMPEDAEALARHAATVRDARSILERIPTDQVFELPGRPHVCFQVSSVPLPARRIACRRVCSTELVPRKMSNAQVCCIHVGGPRVFNQQGFRHVIGSEPTLCRPMPVGWPCLDAG